MCLNVPVPPALVDPLYLTTPYLYCTRLWGLSGVSVTYQTLRIGVPDFNNSYGRSEIWINWIITDYCTFVTGLRCESFVTCFSLCVSRLYRRKSTISSKMICALENFLENGPLDNVLQNPSIRIVYTFNLSCTSGKFTGFCWYNWTHCAGTAGTGGTQCIFPSRTVNSSVPNRLVSYLWTP